VTKTTVIKEVVMGKNKFYAVKEGKRPGVYQTWAETEEQVNGYSGAEYKGFKTLKEAEFYLSSDLASITTDNTEVEEINADIERKIKTLTSEQVLAFVDGSYSKNVEGKEKYGFGVVLVNNDAEVTLFKAFVSGPYMNSANVAGEIEGAKEAILWAINNNKKEITVYYDYEGVEKWATKEWKAKKDLTKEYSKFYDEKSLLITIIFVNVSAHKGIKYNEKADALAKRSLLDKGYKTYIDGSVYFTGFNTKDWYKLIEYVQNDYKEFDEDYVINIEEKQITDYNTYIKIKKGKSTVTINCYKGDKAFVQGKQTALHQKLMAYAIESLPDEHSVIETLNSYHALTLDEFSVQKRLVELLPNFAKDTTDEKHYNNIMSSVFNTMLVGYMPEYTCLLQPVFRGTEYYLHRILNDKLGKETADKNGNNDFGFFDKDKDNRYSYNSKFNGLNDKQIGLLNDTYNFYNKIRHPYSHWSKESVNTSVITSMETARDLILEGFILFDKYYIMF